MIEAMKTTANWHKEFVEVKNPHKENEVIRFYFDLPKAEKQDGDCQRCGGKGCVACDARWQEPVAWVDSDWQYQLHKKGMVIAHKDKSDVLVGEPQPLYTHPQPKREQEPVLWVMPDGKTVDKWGLQFYGGQTGKPLYAHKREWVGLTDEEVKHEWEVWRANVPRYAGFAKGIEAKLRERNT